MNKVKISKFLSYILRHNPDAIGVRMDEHGWVIVSELLSCMEKTEYKITLDLLEEIVSEDIKQRYSFNEDKSKIRANQGHSIKVDVQLQEVKPPKQLYHGTATRFVDSIMKTGLNKGNRLYVHLSSDTDTAIMVGKRHGKPIVFIVEAEQMYADGYKFYLSENNVWLCDEVPVKYLHLIKE